MKTPIGCAALALIVLAACSDGSDGPNGSASGNPDAEGAGQGDGSEGLDEPPPETPTYYRDVRPLLHVKCNGCHTGGGVAPFGLESYEAASPLAATIAAVTADKVMPPWPASTDCHELRGADRVLTANQIELLRRWADTGAQEGSPNDDALPERPEPATLANADYEVGPDRPYMFNNRALDEYTCIRLPSGISQTQYINGIEFVPGSIEAVHHIFGFRQPGGGNQPMGVENAFPCPFVPTFETELLGGWVPGMEPVQTGANMGIRLEPADAIVIQIHYHQTASGQPIADTTRFRFTVAKGEVTPVRIVWTGTIGIDIPPASAATVTEECAIPALGAPIPVLGAIGHMHEVGVGIKSEVVRTNGSRECLLDIPRWDFNWQMYYQFKEPFMLQPGDRLITSCQYDNRSNQRVTFGEGTGDEMCFQFNVVADNGVLPEKCFFPCTTLPNCESFAGFL
jgi:hypothetical protein